MMKLKFCRGSFKLGGGNNNNKGGEKGCCGSITNTHNNEIKWELRPGGMLVQKRECGDSVAELITVRVSTLSQWHEISVEPTSTFGELKMILSLVSGMEPREQRLLFKGKEREDGEYLHMVGVRDKDKVFLLQDPANKEGKLIPQSITTPYRTISV